MPEFPYIDDDTDPFWEAIERGELAVQRCMACERAVFYPRAICPHCGDDRLRWEKAKTTGVVYSFTVVRRAQSPFDGEVPFVVALVEIEPGFRMMTRLLDCDPQEARIGLAVTLRVAALGDGPLLPCFVPAATG